MTLAFSDDDVWACNLLKEYQHDTQKRNDHFVAVLVFVKVMLGYIGVNEFIN